MAMGFRVMLGGVCQPLLHYYCLLGGQILADNNLYFGAKQ